MHNQKSDNKLISASIHPSLINYIRFVYRLIYLLLVNLLGVDLFCHMPMYLHGLGIAVLLAISIWIVYQFFHIPMPRYEQDSLKRVSTRMRRIFFAALAMHTVIFAVSTATTLKLLQPLISNAPIFQYDFLHVLFIMLIAVSFLYLCKQFVRSEMPYLYCYRDDINFKPFLTHRLPPRLRPSLVNQCMLILSIFGIGLYCLPSIVSSIFISVIPGIKLWQDSCILLSLSLLLLCYTHTRRYPIVPAVFEGIVYLVFGLMSGYTIAQCWIQNILGMPLNTMFQWTPLAISLWSSIVVFSLVYGILTGALAYRYDQNDTIQVCQTKQSRTDEFRTFSCIEMRQYTTQADPVHSRSVTTYNMG